MGTLLITAKHIATLHTEVGFGVGNLRTALAAKINEANITIATKASEAGKVFGSVTSIQMAEELGKQGIAIDKRTIALKEAIKELGTFKVAVKLHREVSAEFTVNVVAE